MTTILVRKFLRDVWLVLVVVALLLVAFQCLWAHVTQQISTELLPELTEYIQAYYRKKVPTPVQLLLPIPDQHESEEVGREIQQLVFKGPGKIVQSLVGGDTISLADPRSLMTVGFVHPFVQVILCIWAIGRAAGALSGEIDRGTMELLLAQPVPRGRVVLAHFLVDLVVVPVLCLAIWGGSSLGAWLVGLVDDPDSARRINPLNFAAGLPAVGLLLFAVSGMTMLVSALGRFRSRVLGLAVLLTLVQFLVNLIGQVWSPMAGLRPLTVFYYYQPQALILGANQAGLIAKNFIVLLAVGASGYLLALWTFSRRDLPAPL
jgi:ABC-2 type transport system permease protein